MQRFALSLLVVLTLCVVAPGCSSLANLQRPSASVTGVTLGGDIPYDLDGGLSFDTGNPFGGALRVPLRHSGTLPLRQVLNDPQALLRNPAARRLATTVLGGLFRR